MAGVTGAINFSVFSHDKPLQLFRADPAFAPYRHVDVVPRSVRLVATVSVPSVGKVQYWVARTVNGWRCAAFKLPNGEWAGTTRAGSNRYGFRGAVPGCRGPWITWEGPAFRYEGIYLGAVVYRHWRVVSGRSYALVYGTVHTTGTPVEVRDLVTGASTRVLRGGYFALVIPARLELDPRTPQGLAQGAPRNADGYYIPYVHVQAIDAAGRALVLAPVDHVTFGR